MCKGIIKEQGFFFFPLLVFAHGGGFEIKNKFGWGEFKKFLHRDWIEFDCSILSPL